MVFLLFFSFRNAEYNLFATNLSSSVDDVALFLVRSFFNIWQSFAVFLFSFLVRNIHLVEAHEFTAIRMARHANLALFVSPMKPTNKQL